MGQLENELTDTQTKLETATKNLEEKEKALQNVSLDGLSICDAVNANPMHDMMSGFQILILADHWICKVLMTSVWSFWVTFNAWFFSFFTERNQFSCFFTAVVWRVFQDFYFFLPPWFKSTETHDPFLNFLLFFKVNCKLP